MKKSILCVIVLMLVASMFMLTACDTAMFPLNAERAGNQVTATVNFGDRVGTVDVNEIYSSFYSYYNYLYQYYQYGYIDAATFQNYMNNLDEVFADSNESLAKSALYTVKCVDYLFNYYAASATADPVKVAAMKAASTAGKRYDFTKLDEYKAYRRDRLNEMQLILACYSDYSYVNAAIRATNEEMQKLFDQHLEEVRQENEVQVDEESVVPAGFVDIELAAKPIRLVYEVGTEEAAKIDTRGLVVNAIYEDGSKVEIPVEYLNVATYNGKTAAEDVEIKVTYGDYSEVFSISVVVARPDREQPAKEEETEAEDNSVLLDRFSFEIAEDDYITEGLLGDELDKAYEELKFARTAMSRVLGQLEDNFRTYDDYLLSYMTTQIRNAVDDMITATVLISEAELEAEYERLIAEQYAAYLTTPYSSTSLDNALTIVHPTYVDESDAPSYGHYYISQVLFSFGAEQSAIIKDFENEKTATDEAIQFLRNQQAKKIGVWLSNPDYDPNAVCEEETCTCPHCANYEGERVEYTTLDQWYSCIDGCTCAACPSNKYLNDEPVNVLDVMDQISADLDVVNSTVYATESERLAAQLEAINAWIYKANEDPGAFTAIKDKEYGYVMTPEGITSGMVDSFDKACRMLAKYDGVAIPASELAELEEEGVFMLTTKGGKGGYAYCVSTYGVHFVTLTAYVADSAAGTVNNGQLVDDVQYVELGLDYVVRNYDYEVVTSGNEYKVSKADGSTYYLAKGTIAAYVYDSLYADAISAAKAKFQRDFYADNLKEDNIQYYPNGYKYLLEQVQEQQNG